MDNTELTDVGGDPDPNSRGTLFEGDPPLVVIVTPIFPDSRDRTSALRLVPISRLLESSTGGLSTSGSRTGGGVGTLWGGKGVFGSSILVVTSSGSIDSSAETRKSKTEWHLCYTFMHEPVIKVCETHLKILSLLKYNVAKI